MDMIHDLTQTRRGDPAPKFYGVVPAIVTHVKEPSGQQRHEVAMVRVRFPGLQDENDPDLINPYARLMRADAGENCGHGVVPQVDDEVICGFEHGDLRYPYVIG
ncbi:MAG: phage baseplate assembly protein V [Planctomycetota bacterium]|jgi:uncharacterized protein involved in type VI secretion and phage assembly